MKIQKSVIFVKKNKYLKHKKYRKFRDHYTGEHRSAAHHIRLKYSVSKKILIVSHNGSILS